VDGLHLREDAYQRWSGAIAQKIDTLPLRLGAGRSPGKK
jgi:lysophospholipase L1-like esterase